MILRVLEAARDRSQKKKTLLRSMQCILSWKKANMDAVQGRFLWVCSPWTCGRPD